MREFFRGWRRKIGLALLLLASSVLVLWIRSQFTYDAISFVLYDRQHRIDSLTGHISWWSWDVNRDRPVSGWVTMAFQPGTSTADAVLTIRQTKRAILYLTDNPHKEWSFHYWSIVWPLTLLSALLILWKPRYIAFFQGWRRKMGVATLGVLLASLCFDPTGGLLYGGSLILLLAWLVSGEPIRLYNRWSQKAVKLPPSDNPAGQINSP